MSADLHHYKDALIVLATAGIVVPAVHAVRVSPVLGYLAAGALLGPSGLGALAQSAPWLDALTFTNASDIDWIAELGVVFLLFVIGLELSAQRLATMRRLVFGLGSLQVAVAGLAIGLTAPLFGNDVAASVLIGLALALSSTAMVLDRLSVRKRMTTAMGRASFSVLLFQDLAVVPILFLVGILARDGGGSVTIDLLIALGQAFLAIVAIILAGRVLLRPLFRLVAGTGAPELFMATTLLIAIGSGVLTAAAGLSMALGGFVAGLLLAETEFRKAIEAVIEPFKGLLLGVFFISVGTRIDVAALLYDPFYLLFCAGGLVLLKIVVLVPLGRWFGLTWGAAAEMALLLGSGGEFAFIIIGIASAGGVIPGDVAGLLLAVVALTMAAIPLLGQLGERAAAAIDPPAPLAPALLETPPSDPEAHAIVVGFGRVGRLVCEMLARHGVPHLLVDSNPGLVTHAREDGHAVYFGDAKSPLFLQRCGLDKATALIITINDQSQIDEIVTHALGLRTDLPIVARARDAAHAQRLYRLGVRDAVPETVEASLQLSEAALVALGVPSGAAIASIHDRRDAFRAALAKDMAPYMASRDRPIRGLRASQRRKDDDGTLS